MIVSIIRLSSRMILGFLTPVFIYSNPIVILVILDQIRKNQRKTYRLYHQVHLNHKQVASTVDGDRNQLGLVVITMPTETRTESWNNSSDGITVSRFPSIIFNNLRSEHDIWFRLLDEPSIWSRHFQSYNFKVYTREFTIGCFITTSVNASMESAVRKPRWWRLRWSWYNRNKIVIVYFSITSTFQLSSIRKIPF